MNKIVPDDKYYLDEIKLGNESALGALYKLLYPSIAHFIISNSGTEQEAKDVFQEAMIGFYEKLQGDRLQLNCKIKTYIYSVCRRLWMKRLSVKAMYTNKLNDTDTFIEVEGDAAEIETQERNFRQMQQALQDLREPCKTIIEDYYIRKLSMEAIAEKFGYTNADNAKNQKYKCLQRLKKLFFQEVKKSEI